MKKTLITVISAFSLFISCQKQAKKEVTVTENKTEEIVAPTFAENIEKAHKKADFLKHEAIQYNTVIEFGGNEIFNATITVSTTSDIAKIVYKNGDEIYVNKEKTFVSPSLKENPQVRFHAYTWNYFFLFPYKLNDNGTIWDDNFKTNETENPYNTAKLTFEANTGDAPDDWYVVYENKETNLLNHAAYIVSLGKTVEAAEADPHAIKYIDYSTIDGIPFATNWEFYGWNLNEGLTTKIGSAVLTDIKFVEGFRENFKVPENYIAK
ncbi:hypothetical protein [Polaribacter sargassicola]|uniref:hypothetical protein n=1 Tax=Polaribacter sargassicola TaxID=2836891 RepID=UPI001F2FEB6A|nr:hypothetical protein [Polaribacter sp. DS7-9]MCG1036508.1 hypothetical protein [Polaribacter sp. DS7-9]